MSVEENILSLLENEEVDYDRSTHEPVYTSAEAADVRGVPLDTGVKAMVLENQSGELVLGLIPADHKVDLDKMEEEEDSEVALANPEKVLKITGSEVGSVPPFGHAEPLKTYLDPEILEKDRVNFNAGRHEVSIDLNPEDLKKCIEASGAGVIVKRIAERKSDPSSA